MLALEPLPYLVLAILKGVIVLCLSIVSLGFLLINVAPSPFCYFYKIGTKVKGVDLDAPGSINGVPLLEVDLDSFEDKPWRKPGKIIVCYSSFKYFWYKQSLEK